MKVERGIRRKPGRPGLEAYVRVDGRQSSRYFAADTPLAVVREWRARILGRPYDPVLMVDIAAPPDGKTWIYFVKVGTFVKIGQARNPKRRIAELQVSHAQRFKLVALLAAAPDLEGLLHAYFDASHENGEWFYATDELRALMDLIRAGEVDESELRNRLAS